MVKLVGILGKESLARGKKLLHHCGEVKLLTGGSLSCFQKVEGLQLLLVLPDGESKEGERLPPTELLILPDTKLSWLENDESHCVMTYGLGSKDSLTLSSIEEGTLLLVLQRELVTLEGGSVERGEVAIPRKGGEKHEEILGFVALLLVCGVDISALGEIFGGD